jgi:hypothetical protein
MFFTVIAQSVCTVQLLLSPEAFTKAEIHFNIILPSGTAQVTWTLDFAAVSLISCKPAATSDHLITLVIIIREHFAVQNMFVILSSIEQISRSSK